MAKFTRVQLIVHEDVTRSLQALQADLEASSAALISHVTKVMDLLPDDSKLAQLRASLWKFQRTTSLKVDLPLVELEAAHKDIEAFMSDHLQELRSENESQQLIGELSRQLSKHNR